MSDLVDQIRKATPRRLKVLLRARMDLSAYDLPRWRRLVEEAARRKVDYTPAYPYTIGIIEEFSAKHIPYIDACRDLKVNYKILSIAGDDWVDIIRTSGCDAFLVRPSPDLTVWKAMFDERVRLMEEEMGLLVFPGYKASWIYESKRRMRDWLVVNNVPHPRTWIFYDKSEAIAFVENAPLPMMFKTDFGTCAAGIRVIRSKGDALTMIDQMFGKGVRITARDGRDMQWGYVIFQEYFPKAWEWRMIRIGESYFAYIKLRKGDFASGAPYAQWADPPKKLLDFTREITEKGGFTSMNVDIFETPDGKYLVNELQTCFGGFDKVFLNEGDPSQCPVPAQSGPDNNLKSQLYIDGKPGRYVCKDGAWLFEEGEFCANHCENLRVQWVLKLLDDRNKAH